MKGLFLTCLLVAGTLAFPPARKSESEEIFDKIFGPSSGFFEPGSKESSSFKFFEPESEESSEASDEVVAFFPITFFNPFTSFFGNPFQGMPNFRNIFRAMEMPDLDKTGNTTSETKVIDGHKVTINQTTYENKDDDGFFRIKIVRIFGGDDGETASEATPESESASESATEASIPVSDAPTTERDSMENEVMPSARIKRSPDSAEREHIDELRRGTRELDEDVTFVQTINVMPDYTAIIESDFNAPPDQRGIFVFIEKHPKPEDIDDEEPTVLALQNHLDIDEEDNKKSAQDDTSKIRKAGKLLQWNENSNNDLTNDIWVNDLLSQDPTIIVPVDVELINGEFNGSVL